MYVIFEKDIHEYLEYLRKEEKSKSSIEKYHREIRKFLSWNNDCSISKERVINYKKHLIEVNKITTINGSITALNCFFRYLNYPVSTKTIRAQKQAFYSKGKELKKCDFEKLSITAKENKNTRLYLILQTMYITGIRVSEIKAITVEGASIGEVEITNKGKTRLLYLPRDLREGLIKYASKRNIKKGPLFLTKFGEPVDRSNVWEEMKRIARIAGVDQEKVYPHNIRKLFARLYYDAEKDIVSLADILGHSDVNTTRIYLQESKESYIKKVEKYYQILLKN